MWANFDYFLDAVLPVAEESGVVLALHPDDPPVESVRDGLHVVRALGARAAVGWHLWRCVVQHPVTG